MDQLFLFSFELPCPIGGPSLLFEGTCKAKFYKGDFDGFEPVTVKRDGTDMLDLHQTLADRRSFLAAVASRISDHNTRPMGTPSASNASDFSLSKPAEGNGSAN